MGYHSPLKTRPPAKERQKPKQRRQKKEDRPHTRGGSYAWQIDSSSRMRMVEMISSTTLNTYVHQSAGFDCRRLILTKKIVSFVAIFLTTTVHININNLPRGITVVVNPYTANAWQSLGVGAPMIILAMMCVRGGFRGGGSMSTDANVSDACNNQLHTPEECIFLGWQINEDNQHPLTSRRYLVYPVGALNNGTWADCGWFHCIRIRMAYIIIIAVDQMRRG